MGNRGTVFLRLRPREWRLTLCTDLAEAHEMILLNIIQNAGVLLHDGRLYPRCTG